ncbi:hypothetical protein LEP1GSC168_1937 [Leptospira santarosai str. HAI134]|nr:hypothetical protein LEP1GSC168_1937 [Leptospira santarosai str. HAI134]
MEKNFPRRNEMQKTYHHKEVQKYGYKEDFFHSNGIFFLF